MAINGQTAQFQAGGEFPVPNATATFGTVGQSVTFVPFGVSLTFVPYITDRDRIRLQLFGRVSTTDASLGATVGGTSVPGLQARTFRTTLENARRPDVGHGRFDSEQPHFQHQPGAVLRRSAVGWWAIWPATTR